MIMEQIKVDANRYVALLELEHRTKRDEWYKKERSLEDQLQAAKERWHKLCRSLATCSCGNTAKTHLIYLSRNYKSGSGDGYGYYECPECDKRWALRELLPPEG